MKALVLAALLSFAGSLGAQERTFELTYVTELDVPEGKMLHLWIPYPNANDYQDVRLVSIDSPVPTKLYQEYTYRNSMLFSSIATTDIEAVRVEMKVRVTRRAHIEEGFEELEDPEGYIEASARRWLFPVAAVPDMDEALVARAEALTEGEDAVSKKARILFDAVVDEGGTDDDFIALARAAGIPAKAATGFRLPRERGEGEIEAPGRWASFYVPGYGWIPVDVVEARGHPEMRDRFFGAHDENRVELTAGRDIVLNPRPAAGPVDTFIFPYAEIDGKPIGDVRARVFYRDLEHPAE